MGNYKFRFSDMIPNAWFYKLRDMSLNSASSSSSSSSHKQHHFNTPNPRKSHYFTRDLHISPPDSLQPPQKPSTQQRHRRAATSDAFTHFSSTSFDDHLILRTNDIVLDVTGDVPELVLPPIKTKPPKNAKREPQRPTHEAKNANANANRRKPNLTTSSGVRLRVNSPKIGGRRVLTGSRGGKAVRSPVFLGGSSVFSDSFVVVKTSLDPYGDFKTSMMEMIVENGVRGKKDLEELLACYLSLNSDEYHDLIVTVFKQIWIDFICLRSK